MTENSEKNYYPRDLAVRVLTRVLSQNEPLDEALSSVSGEKDGAQSIAWLQEVCSGTLRWKGRLDSILDTIATRKKPSGWLRKILLIAIYQLVVQDRVQAGLVVSETVSRIKAQEGEPPAKFANACLRKVSEYAQQWKNQTFDSSVSMSQMAQWASLPEWLWKKISSQRGSEWAVAYAKASLDRPQLWIRSKQKEWNPGWVKSGPIDHSFLSVEGGAITSREGFTEGEFIVQDISSQILIEEVTRYVKQELTEYKVLDLCAAPGGKSIGLAWNGFDVTATDRNQSRIPKLKESISRAASQVRLISWEEANRFEDFNLIWVDAPCSGTGILRRHPDVRWLRQEKEIPSLMATQRKLLKDCWDKARSGSFIVYSVCSVLEEEGSRVIQDLGLESSVVQKWDLSPQLQPHGDGFWAALLRK